MDPLAIDKQLGKAVKAVNPLNTPVVVKRPHELQLYTSNKK
jgi:hypothetical protein